MAKLTKTEMLNYRKYHIPSCGNLNRVKLDAVFYNIHSKSVHELKKAEVCWEIKKSGQHFLTEAERNIQKGEPRRRIDVVNLTTGEEIEIVDTSCPPSAKEEGCTIIKVGD